MAQRFRVNETESRVMEPAVLAAGATRAAPTAAPPPLVIPPVPAPAPPPVPEPDPVVLPPGIVMEVAPEPETSSAASLQAAAECLMALVPEHIGSVIREIAVIHLRLPLPFALMGYVLQAYENGTLSSPALDPSWPHRFDLPNPVAHESRCEICQAAFTPTRYKQRACSQTCGQELARRDTAGDALKRRRPMVAM